MDTIELKKWYIENNVEKHTVESFWGYFNNYRKEDIHDFEDTFGYHIDDRLIKVKKRKVQLAHIFEYGDFIYSILDIYYMDDYIAEYKLVFTLDGNVADDILRTQSPRHIRKLTDEANRSIKIAKKSLKENLNIELISKITGLSLEFITKLTKK